jgi:Zn-dependent peptidase ImmA (M78 family)
MQTVINPVILKWARETAGLDVETAAKKIGIKNSKNQTAEEKLIELEDGSKAITRSLLYKMSKHYRRPLIIFYLDNPPKQENFGGDFRSLPSYHSNKDDVMLNALIRDIKARQYLVHSILEEEGRSEIPSLNSLNIHDNVLKVVDSIKEQTKIDITEYRNKNDITNAFKYLRDKIEDIGIFVLLLGNLGSHHTNISLETFRGLAYTDPIAPFIAINDQDIKTAWSFTLIHELVHLLLGKSGISNINEFTIESEELKIEKFCNDITSEILLPSNEIKDLPVDINWNIEELKNFIASFAKERHISNSMVAYTLYRNNKINKDIWNKLSTHFKEEWEKNKEKNKEKNQKKEGGPDYYLVKKYKIGSALINLTKSALFEGVISVSKAAKVLGVNPMHVYTLIEKST